MKTILIATDFSKASNNAFVYGVEFAKGIKAKIILFNAYPPAKQAASINMNISRYGIMTQTEERLLDEADILDPKREIIETLCAEGLPADTIIKIANEKKVDFIITGMKGNGKNFKRIFGSTATALAKKSNIPLIIVPEKAKLKNLEIMIFADDAPPLEKSIPEYITGITQIFKSKLYIVKVIRNEQIFELNKPRILKESKDVTTFEYATDTDISYALDSFIEMHKADMLIMIPHKHIWLKRMFIKSETKHMIFHTHVPLLLLPEKILEETHSLFNKKKKQNISA